MWDSRVTGNWRTLFGSGWCFFGTCCKASPLLKGILIVFQNLRGFHMFPHVSTCFHNKIGSKLQLFIPTYPFWSPGKSWRSSNLSRSFWTRAQSRWSARKPCSFWHPNFPNWHKVTWKKRWTVALWGSLWYVILPRWSFDCQSQTMAFRTSGRFLTSDMNRDTVSLNMFAVTPRLPASDPAYPLTCSNPCVRLAFFTFRNHPNPKKSLKP